jgi:hypothetical protein
MRTTGYGAQPLTPGQLGHDPAPNPTDPTDQTDSTDPTAADETGPVHEVAALLATMSASTQLLAQGYPMWSLPEDAIGQLASAAEDLAVMARNLTAVATGEAIARGLPVLDGLSVTDWLTQHARSLQGPAASQVTTVAGVLGEPRWAVLAEQVRAGTITVEKAALIIRLDADVRRYADPEHVDGITDAMTETAPLLSVKELQRLAAHARASLKPPKDLEEQERGQRMGRSFTKTGTSAGMTEYRLRLDPEGAAIVDAALDPLSRPRPDLGWDAVTKDDPRRPDTRRADGLLELIGRAVAAPEGVTRTPRTKVVITLSYETLFEQTRGAGTTDSDQVLSPATIRRMACEAEIIPVVLGGPSQPLDLGRIERYFTPAQRRALALRDKGCTFPGCTIPPQWCEAHHNIPWHLGGPTDLGNGFLVCGRHHTIVHERDLKPTITSTGVIWHY